MKNDFAYKAAFICIMAIALMVMYYSTMSDGTIFISGILLLAVGLLIRFLGGRIKKLAMEFIEDIKAK